MPDDETVAGTPPKRGTAAPEAKQWKFEEHTGDALDQLNQQVASLTAWCQFLDDVDWSQVPRKRTSPGGEKKPPPPPPDWPPA